MASTHLLLCCACALCESPLPGKASRARLLVGWCSACGPLHYIAIIWQTHAKFGRLRGRSACRAICCRQRVGLECQRRLFRQGAQPAHLQLPGPWGAADVVPKMAPQDLPLRCGLGGASGPQNTRKKIAAAARPSCTYSYQNESISMAAIKAIRRPMPPALRNAAPPWPSTRCGTPLARLVPQPLLRAPRARPATRQAEQVQVFFRCAPPAALCGAFVHGIGDKGQEVDGRCSAERPQREPARPDTPAQRSGPAQQQEQGWA